MKTRFFLSLTVLSLTFVLLSSIASAENNIKIYVNENLLQCETAPYIDNGRTMVPMRRIFEALDAELEWEDTTKTITAVKDDIEISLQINSDTITVNGQSEYLDVAPVIVNDSTFVPLRAVSQSLNASVEWNDYIKTAYINSPNAYTIEYEEPEPEIPSYEDATILVKQAKDFINKGMYLEAVTECDNAIYWHYLSPDDVALFKELKATAQSKYDSYLESEKNKAYTNSYSSGSSYSSSSSTNSPNSGGASIYRTPTGSRYHFDPDCGGKNSTPTTLEKAKAAGLTPCKKCAY